MIGFTLSFCSLSLNDYFIQLGELEKNKITKLFLFVQLVKSC